MAKAPVFPRATLEWPTVRGKQPEMAKRNEHGMGISSRALGRDATARFDLGMRRDRTGSFLEWRRRATSSGGGFSWRSCDEGKGERWMRQGRSGVAPMDSEIVMAAATYWSQEEERRRLGMKEDSVCRCEGRLAVPRFIKREGHWKIAAASTVGAHEREESGRQFCELLLRGSRTKDGLMSALSCCCCRGWARPSRKDLSWLEKKEEERK